MSDGCSAGSSVLFFSFFLSFLLKSGFSPWALEGESAVFSSQVDALLVCRGAVKAKVAFGATLRAHFVFFWLVTAVSAVFLYPVAP